MNNTYRTGRKQDCSKLAEFIYIASDGVVGFLCGVDTFDKKKRPE